MTPLGRRSARSSPSRSQSLLERRHGQDTHSCGTEMTIVEEKDNGSQRKRCVMHKRLYHEAAGCVPDTTVFNDIFASNPYALDIWFSAPFRTWITSSCVSPSHVSKARIPSTYGSLGLLGLGPRPPVCHLAMYRGHFARRHMLSKSSTLADVGSAIRQGPR